MSLHTDLVFAPLDHDLQMERIAGGNETEVYVTDDRRYVVKVKSDLGGDLRAALDAACSMRDTAEQFAACLGEQHTIASYYVVARDDDGRAQALVIQPFLHHARPLAAVDYAALSGEEQRRLAHDLAGIIWHALAFYRMTGCMPDLYGRSSANRLERHRENTLDKLPKRLWGFLVRRNLLRSHNLMLTEGPDRQVVLVDYDAVRRSWLYRFVYFAARAVLFARDYAWILWMGRGGSVPHA